MALGTEQLLVTILFEAITVLSAIFTPLNMVMPVVIQT